MAVENTQRLAAVGPADPGHGYPLWFEDGNGVRLELGLGPDPLLPAIDEPVPSTPVPGMPFPATFPAEAFYFLAESRMPIGQPGGGVTGRARLILGLEAAFGTPDPDPRSRVVFARIRVRIDDVVPFGFYTVTHPYGVSDPLQADDRGRVFVTDDRGIADNQFQAVVDRGLVAPFLRWVNGAPAGYLGDGATERPVTGSPFGTNFFRVDGDGVAEVAGALTDPGDPLNPNRIQSSLFTVQGKIATRNGAEITAAHYVRSGGAVIIDLHARSVPGQALQASGTDVARTALLGTGRAYAARLAATAVPTEISVVNTTDTPASATTAPVTDRITASAVHDLSTQTLTVTAASSDDTGPALTAEGLGPLTGPSTDFPGVVATPAMIMITSAGGGRTPTPVALAGAPQPALPLAADAGPDRSLPFGDDLIMDGTGSGGGITTWAWTQVSGPAAVLDTSGAATTPVHPSAPGAYVFRLTVTDSDGATASDDVAITVDAAVPDTVVVTRAQFRTGRDEYRVEGTQTGTRPATIRVEFNGTELGTSPVDATGAWAVRRSITPAENALQPGVGDTVTVTSSRGGTANPVVQIRN